MDKVRCYITMRDLVTWPQQMLPHVRRLGLTPVLCDNASTYGPLLDWYKTDPCEIRRYPNDGCYGFFNRKDLEKEPGWCVVTDCDLDLSGVPDDFLHKAIASYNANPGILKVGLSLEIDDVPHDTPVWGCVAAYEPKYWTTRSVDGQWLAPIGATFALYNGQHTTGGFYTGVRLDRPYTARHWPWYLRPADYTEEYLYYLSRSNHLPVYTNYIKRAQETKDVRYSDLPNVPPPRPSSECVGAMAGSELPISSKAANHP